MSFIERVRQKPRQVRGRYAFLIAALVTLLVGSVWVTTVPARFAEISSVSTTAAPAEPSALSDMYASIKNQANAITGSERTADELEPFEDNSQDATLFMPEPGEDPFVVDAAPPEDSEAIEAATTTPQVHEDGERDDTTNEEPRVILIGTTTSQKSE